MTTATKNKQVSVDAGDLDEAMQAANAWASQLRDRAVRARKSFGALPIADEDSERYSSTADRIDAACARLRAQQYDGLRAG